jgi:hypothetical protein
VITSAILVTAGFAALITAVALGWRAPDGS